ncbi:sulfur carrier protein ThiS [Porcipelethomonas sp.]|uniref:sulfur carrier protein ThiS n=1 Tax=Porcipelethomonas sp. TaxID=2981675 RepID=UPI003EF9A093
MKINGKETEFTVGDSLADILEKNGFNLKKIAVMKNGEIVPKAEYAQTKTESDDSLEVVSFVGGG